MSFIHPGRRSAVPDAVAPRDAKVDGWASMKHLFELQLRSKAPQLKVRLAASLALVLSGKALGVWAPLVMGQAINVLADYSVAQGYDYRFALEPKPNEPRGNIYLPTVGRNRSPRGSLGFGSSAKRRS